VVLKHHPTLLMNHVANKLEVGCFTFNFFAFFAVVLSFEPALIFCLLILINDYMPMNYDL
jgi:hypothetical protein